MSSAPVNGSKPTGWPSARGGPLTVAELTRRGFARLAERIDVARARHKPLSLLRQEAKRVLEALLDADGGHLSKGEQERVIEDVVSGTLGFSPLEELFRDETRQEILTLAWNQVIARVGEQWLPTSARFRDADQYREFVLRLAEVGTATGEGPEPGGAFDVLLPNGFRAVAILPPAVMGQPPLVLLARGEPRSAGVAPKSAVVPVPLSRADAVPAARSGPVPAPSRSGVVAAPPARAPGATMAASGDSLFQPPAAPRPVASSGLLPRPSVTVEPGAPDPLARLRTRVTERLIARCAAAGVYDLTQVPTAELRRILSVHVAEVATAERVRLDEAEQERLTLQILVAMNR